MEQQEEIKQLRQYLRDIFEQQEDKIVSASYEPTIDQGHANGRSQVIDQIDQSPTLKDIAGKMRGPKAHSQLRKTEKRPNNLKAVSNIHQLYQDLFITDMKDEIASAGNEVVQLRQELLRRD